MRRLRQSTRTVPMRSVGSAVWHVFEGEALATVGDKVFAITKGDLFVVPSWCQVTLTARAQTDLFRFSDEPVYVALGLAFLNCRR
ncbi:hypothetical protein [Streptomyces sp. NPDC001815]|uniref:hypothetical protein n=1 Tax=Streptomyces sp. NPDC001815 TaxID=3154526 RepID=UPI00331EBFDC